MCVRGAFGLAFARGSKSFGVCLSYSMLVVTRATAVELEQLAARDVQSTTVVQFVVRSNEKTTTVNRSWYSYHFLFVCDKANRAWAC